jgi:hypothetical protein
MKKIALRLGLLAILLVPVLSSCETEVKLTDEEIVAALKEALSVGTDNSVAAVNKTDGYFGDASIKIPFPEEAAIVQTTLNSLPGGDLLVNELVLKLNRTAENAADKAGPIYLNAITNLTIDDGLTILQGNDDAATRYLETQTRAQLYTEFKPDIEAALSSVGATTAWTSVINTYNAIPFHDPANADLPDYTTNKALDGLFVKIAGEELKIRKDPVARVSDLLKKVFGQLD